MQMVEAKEHPSGSVLMLAVFSKPLIGHGSMHLGGKNTLFLE